MVCHQQILLLPKYIALILGYSKSNVFIDIFLKYYVFDLDFFT